MVLGLGNPTRCMTLIPITPFARIDGISLATLQSKKRVRKPGSRLAEARLTVEPANAGVPNLQRVASVFVGGITCLLEETDQKVSSDMGPYPMGNFLSKWNLLSRLGSIRMVCQIFSFTLQVSKPLLSAKSQKLDPNRISKLGPQPHVIRSFRRSKKYLRISNSRKFCGLFLPKYGTKMRGIPPAIDNASRPAQPRCTGRSVRLS